MKIKEQWIESIPEFWLCPIINDDYSGLELYDNYEAEKKEIDDFVQSIYDEYKSSPIFDPWFKEDNEHYFGVFHGIGHTLIDVQITVFES
jgi:hypothetical protein